MNGRSCGRVSTSLVPGTWDVKRVTHCRDAGELLWFIFAELFTGGGLTAAVMTLVTSTDKNNSKEMAEDAATSQDRFCSRDWGV